MENPNLLLIPGLGDRAWLYRSVVPLWRGFGYDVHVHAFGWNGGLDELQARQTRLTQVADVLLERELYVIGASAGGVAAINLLTERPQIEKVVTLASPLQPKEVRTYPLLVGAFTQMRDALQSADDSLKQKIVSVHGRYDNRVPVELSKRADIESVGLPTYGHGSTIFSALTIFSGIVRHRLR